MNNIKWLQQFYSSLCNGDREHNYGINITTLDNPGWGIEIALDESELENFTFDDIDINNGDKDWYFCKIKDNSFTGYGSVNNLDKLISIFRSWVEENLND